jgi:hypothetical protein
MGPWSSVVFKELFAQKIPFSPVLKSPQDEHAVMHIT